MDNSSTSSRDPAAAVTGHRTAIKEAFVKRAIIVAVVAALVLAVAPLALAQHGHKGKAPVKFTVSGQVTAVDTATKTVTIKVSTGSKGLAKLRGQELKLSLTDDANIVRYASGEKKTITIAALVVDEKVRAWGVIDRSVPEPVKYQTSRLMVRSTWPFACQGTVTATSTAADAMTLTLTVTKASAGVKAFVGHELTVSVFDTTKIIKAAGGTETTITLAEVQSGDKVVVNGTVDNLDPSARVYQAKRILVKKGS